MANAADKGPQTQAQTASPEPDWKKRNAPDGENADEIQFFDTMVVKLVERENEETGETEWVEVLSDNLYPGEKLKRDVDAEDAADKAEIAREEREERDADREKERAERTKKREDREKANKDKK